MHPDPAALRRFMRGESRPSENREVVRHLLSDCPQCSSITSRESSRVSSEPLPPGEQSPTMADLRGVLSNVESEREMAPLLWKRLEALPQARRKVVVANSRRYQTWSLCELLLEKAFDLGFQAPGEALPLTELAVEISNRLEPEWYSRELVNDFRARALGYRANALRIGSDYRASEQTLSEAFEVLEDGSGDVLEEATLLRWVAFLRSDQARFKDAIGFQRRAIRIYRRAGEEQLANRASISLGTLFGLDGKPEQAVGVLRKTLERLDPTELRWVLACRHNLALNLKRCGRLDEALQVLRETRSLYSEVGDRMILLRLFDLEGQLAREFGNPAEAERALSSACNGYIELGIPFDAAFVGLELADLYLEQGRTTEVRKLSAKLMRAFEALETPTEAMAAVALFRKAVERDALTATLLSDVRSRLERLQTT